MLLSKVRRLFSGRAPAKESGVGPPPEVRNSDGVSAETRDTHHQESQFATAARLARKRRYVDAIQALQGALAAGECSEHDALDLQARIYAQQGLYLHAESCWNKAQQVNGSNPAYALALSRLRRTRRFAGIFYYGLAVLATIAVVGFIVWQTVFVNRMIADHLLRNQESVVTTNHQIQALQDEYNQWGEKISTEMTEHGNRIGEFKTHLNESIKTLPTAHEVAQQTDRIDALESKIVAMGQMLKTVESNYIKLAKQRSAAMARRVRNMQKTIQRDIQSLPTTEDIAVLNHVIAGIEQQLNEMAEKIGQYSVSENAYDSDQ